VETLASIRARDSDLNSSPTPSSAASDRGRLWDAGYKPVPVYGHNAPGPEPGKRPWGRAWQKRARRDPPAAVSEAPRAVALNTGILCDGLRAIDIDIDDRELAHQCQSIAYSIFGEPLIRARRNSPRTLLLYRAAEGWPGKLGIQGGQGRIEVLGRGQQFVAFGRHPSGAALEWYPSAPGDELITSLTPVREDDVREFLRLCGVVLGAPPVALARTRRANHRVTRSPANWVQFARTRIEDLKLAARLMFPGGVVPHGARDLWGFVMACAIAGIYPADEVVAETTNAVRTILPIGFVEDELPLYCSTLVTRAEDAPSERAHRYACGNRGPIYTPSNGWVLRTLGIPPGVQARLTSLIGSEEKRRRRILTLRERGSEERATWLAAHDISRQRPWDADGISRATWYRNRRSAPP
jgi:hypothetical protein